MTMNIPLSLVTTANRNAPDNSPVLWDGSDLVVSKEHLINIVRLRSDLNVLLTKQAEYASEYKKAALDIKNINTAVLNVQSNHIGAVKKIEGAVRDTARLPMQVSGVASTMDDIERTFAANELTVTEAVKLAKLVKSGSLIALAPTNVQDLSIGRSKLGEYVFIDSALDDISILPGKNVSIKYSLAKGNYSIKLDMPKTSALIKSGNMIQIDSNASGQTDVLIPFTAMQVQGGLVVSSSPTHRFSIGFGDKFITSDTTSGITTKKVGNSFVLGLTQEVLDDAAVDYIFNAGLVKVGNKVSVDPNLFPKVVAGVGAKIEKIGNSSLISFDYAGLAKPIPASYSASYPLILDKQEEQGIPTRLTYRVDPTWLAQSSSATELLDKTNDFSSRIASKAIASRTWDDVSEGMRSALACPILNLYRYVTRTSTAVGMVTGSTKAIQIHYSFAAGINQVALDIDILPYYNMMPDTSGSALTLNQPQEFDLYTILQHYLQKRLQDPSFVIDAADKGTKFKVLEVGSALYGKRKIIDLATLYYNMELEVDSLASTSNPEFVAGCPSFVAPSSWVSSRGWKFRVTSGDTDYIIGLMRNGQTNSDRLVFPANLSSANQITMTSVASLRIVGGIEYKLVVQDGYSGNSYSATINRYSGYEQDPDKDYVIEIAGQSNPGHIRAFCRLYVNWFYTDADLNTLVYALGQNDACLAQFISDAYMTNLNTPSASGYYSNYIKENFPEDSEATVILDTTKAVTQGKLKVTASVSTNVALPLRISAYSVLKQIKVSVIYLIDSNMGVTYNSEALFTNCCWD